MTTVMILQPGDRVDVQVAPPIETRAIRIVFQKVDASDSFNLELVGVFDSDGNSIDYSELGDMVEFGRQTRLDLTIVAPSGQLAFPLDAPQLPNHPPPYLGTDLISTRLTRAEMDLINRYRKANEGKNDYEK